MATLSVQALPLPPSANPAFFSSFGREVKGVDLDVASDDQLEQIQKLLYEHSCLLFKNQKVSPESQYKLTKVFDPESDRYGHGNNKTGGEKKSILHPDLKTIPRQPQVQVIGNGTVYDHEGLPEARLKHPHHKTFHKTAVSPEDEEAGVTRFYRWHIDAALYDLSPPKVTTLYALQVPKGEQQTLRYDDGTGDELKVPLGTTAFVSGHNMFEVLSEEEKSLAVRLGVEYAPHPYVWMSSAHALPTGLGLESEGLELDLNDLPPWSQDKIKIFPALWKNPVTSNLHLQIHPSAIRALHIAPLPSTAKRTPESLFPDGATITSLPEVRSVVYRLQRQGIRPELVYTQDWEDGDMVLFHNRGVLHSVVGAFTEDQVRVFHQCNLAGTSDPEGPSEEDIKKWA
ncbi:clavaminate synthase-like protein [Phaffia rhodozyma]|uniref:Clavaminate synthase-like protein n=1 Tax=Phaffia rhodozyma TaxID=264483 RepID=A0A0F7SP63_PHARH|nr:clavaminate synthase-like protein [Phaffia rhodozyma]